MKHQSKTSISNRLFSGAAAVMSGPAKNKTEDSSGHLPVIYLCDLGDTALLRLKVACQTSIDNHNASIRVLETIEGLMSEDIFARDLVIVDRDNTQELMVRNVVSLCDSKPSLIWVERSMSLPKIAEQVNSAFKLMSTKNKE